MPTKRERRKSHYSHTKGVFVAISSIEVSITNNDEPIVIKDLAPWTTQYGFVSVVDDVIIIVNHAQADQN